MIYTGIPSNEEFKMVLSYDELKGIGYFETVTSAASGAINDIIFDGTRYIGVDVGGSIIYSENKKDWQRLSETDTTTFTNNQFATTAINSIIYADGKFVAVGASGKASYSTDGISWTALTPGDDTGIKFGTTHAYSVAYGDGKFVAVGASGKASYSTDGISWTALTAGTETGIKFGISTTANKVGFGNGIFVVVGDSGKSSYSFDGISWSSMEPSDIFGLLHSTGAIYSIILVNNSILVGGASAKLTLAEPLKAKLISGDLDEVVDSTNAVDFEYGIASSLTLTASEMNTDKIYVIIPNVLREVIVTEQGIGNIGGGGSEDVGVINFPPAVLNLIITGLSDNFVLAKAQLQANGHNYYGLRKNNATYLIVKENITSGVLTYAYRSINVGKTFPNAWNSKTNITYSSTQNVI